MEEKKKSRCKTEVFARVTGFFRPVQEWNPGKQAEFSERKKFNLDKLTEEERANGGVE